MVAAVEHHIWNIFAAQPKVSLSFLRGSCSDHDLAHVAKLFFAVPRQWLTSRTLPSRFGRRGVFRTWFSGLAFQALRQAHKAQFKRFHFSLLQNIVDAVKRVRTAFEAGRTKSLTWRRQQLLAIQRLTEENEESIAAAHVKDLSVNKFMTHAVELEVVRVELKIALANLSNWVHPTSVPTPVVSQPGSSYIVPVRIMLVPHLPSRAHRSRTAWRSSSRHGTTLFRLCWRQ